MSGYEPRWDVAWQATKPDGDQGELFERWAVDAIRSGASREVKTDGRSFDTGNVFIERECRISGQWIASGIGRTEAEIWSHIIVGPMIIFAPTQFVLYVASRFGKWVDAARDDRNPTRGWLLPIPDFVRHIADLGRQWSLKGGRPPLPFTDPDAPFGRNAQDQPHAPYGLKVNGRPRLIPGGRRAERGNHT